MRIGFVRREYASRRKGRFRTFSWQTPPSLVPVMLVNGKPVASGWGQVAVALPAGVHLVEIYSGFSRTYRMVTVSRAETSAFDFVALPGARILKYRNGPEFLDDGVGFGNRGHLYVPQRISMYYGL